MLSMFTRNWWVFLVRGIAAIVFGVAAFIWPQVTLAAVVVLFGAYLLVDGFAMILSVAAGYVPPWQSKWPIILSGVLSIVLGIAAFVWTDAVALSVLYIVAFWSIVTGILQAVAAYELRREIDNEIWLGLGGVLSVVFGILLVVFPAAGMLSLLWLVALWAIAFGLSSIAFAYRLHQLNKDLKSGAAAI
jgi:uncharacterized membrane protein HdeD (DUF308 family)